jgi:hypothetical protein
MKILESNLILANFSIIGHGSAQLKLALSPPKKNKWFIVDLIIIITS